ncbi:MAG: dTDP-4-amino-4,6-dideoxygalactose transaminase [Bacteroidota bacterium]|nr:dTDP-4-amino-4,6-dideoxygalactose transaminase [Bacteroidota bacterium]
MIPFNKPYLTGKEAHYMYSAVFTGKLSGNGQYTQMCQNFFEQKYKFKKCLLTTSCTDALEMCALLLRIEPGDEIIIPSYTFVSTALAFIRQGAKVIFADSNTGNPNLDANQIESLITDRTKAIVPVHYAGIACDMDKIMEIAKKYNLFVVEDAAHSIDSYYISSKYGEKRALGSIGHLAAFSFHETKNIISGEGGMLAINDEQFVHRAEIIWEKGTNRAEFFRGEVNKYGWVDIGSSFLPSEVIAAFLWAQIEHLDEIQNRRKELWEQYYKGLIPLAEKGHFSLPKHSDNVTKNAHMFYLICNSLEERSNLLTYLKQCGILAVFHYLSLHISPYYYDKHDGRNLPNCDRYSDCIVRLPMFFELKFDEITRIVSSIQNFYLQI